MSVQIRNPELVRLLAAEFVRRREVSVAAGKTLTINHSLTLAGADGRTLTIPATGTAALRNVTNTFTAAQTINTSTATTGPNPALVVGVDYTPSNVNGDFLTTLVIGGDLEDAGYGYLVGGAYYHTSAAYRFAFLGANTNYPVNGATPGASFGGLVLQPGGPPVSVGYATANAIWTSGAKLIVNGSIAIPDGISAPSTVSGWSHLYVDSTDGNLKIKFGDGTIKTIVTDT